MSRKVSTAAFYLRMTGVVALTIVTIMGPALWLYVFLLGGSRVVFTFEGMSQSDNDLIFLAEVVSFFSFVALIFLIILSRKGDED